MKTQTLYRHLREPRFYIQNFLYIRDLKKRIRLFHLNQPQRIAHRKVEAYRRKHGFIRVRNLKARKLGMSTYWDGRIFHNTATIPNTSSAIVCHDSESVRALLDICKLFYESLPSQIRPMRRYYSKKSIVFENPDDELRLTDPGLRSSITITPAKSAKFGRAPVFHNLHLSEIAHYPESAEELLTGILSAVPDNRNTIIVEETTANGAQGIFYDRWNSNDNYLRLFLPWHILHRYRIPGARVKKTTLDKEEQSLIDKFNLNGEQLEWRRRMIRNKCNNKLELFKQEYPSNPKEAFIYSGSNIFPGAALEWYADNTVQKPILQSAVGYKAMSRDESILVQNSRKPSLRKAIDDWELVDIYELPVQGEEYFIGADASEGISTGDKPAIIVLNTKGEEVAKYSRKTDTVTFAILLAKIGLFYNTALIIPEANNHGGTVIAKLLELGYPNLYRRETLDQSSPKVTKRVGWFNNDVTKLIIINFLRSAIEEFVLTIRSRQVINQMESYVRKSNGKMEGDEDDLVIALALATYALRETLTPIFERKRLHQILHVNEEVAEKIQKVARDEYEFPEGTLGHLDSMIKLAEEDMEDELSDIDFSSAFLSRYYGKDWPDSLSSWPINGGFI